MFKQTNKTVAFPLAGTMLAVVVLAGCGAGDPDASEARCFDATLRSVGTHTHVVYAVSGNRESTETVDTYIVSTEAVFAGATGLVERHVDVREVGAGFISTGSVSYFERPLLKDVYDLLGWVATSTLYPRDDTVRTVTYLPAYTDARSTLALGEVGTYTASGTDVRIATYPFPLNNTSEATMAVTVRFVGVEQVSVTAGTFNACRYEGSEGAEWVYRGISVRKVQGDVTRDMIAGTVNDTPL